ADFQWHADGVSGFGHPILSTMASPFSQDEADLNLSRGSTDSGAYQFCHRGSLTPRRAASATVEASRPCHRYAQCDARANRRRLLSAPTPRYVDWGHLQARRYHHTKRHSRWGRGRPCCGSVREFVRPYSDCTADNCSTILTFSPGKHDSMNIAPSPHSVEQLSCPHSPGASELPY